MDQEDQILGFCRRHILSHTVCYPVITDTITVIIFFQGNVSVSLWFVSNTGSETQVLFHDFPFYFTHLSVASGILKKHFFPYFFLSFFFTPSFVVVDFLACRFFYFLLRLLCLFILLMSLAIVIARDKKESDVRSFDALFLCRPGDKRSHSITKFPTQGMREKGITFFSRLPSSS